MKIKHGWKIVKCSKGKFFSAFAKPPLQKRYHFNKWTYPSKNKTPLFVYKEFPIFYPRPPLYGIQCVYIPSNRKMLKGFSHDVVFADKVKLETLQWLSKSHQPFRKMRRKPPNKPKKAPVSHR